MPRDLRGADTAWPGDRVNTGRRDARQLSELLRLGLLTDFLPPASEQAAVHDSCRAR